MSTEPVTTRPRCSIVMPLFNKVEFTQQCLESIVARTPGDLYEVVLVDNASTDATGDLLGSLDGDVTIIRNTENLGFSAACNQGAEAARGEYILFLNNDTIAADRWLEPLIAVLDADPDVGMVGSRLILPTGQIQHAGVAFADHRGTGVAVTAFHPYAGHAPDAPEVAERRDVSGVTAACMLIRRECFFPERFDEGFWNGYEDVDLCLRVGEAGWRIVYEPASVLVHYESISGPERFAKVSENVVRLNDRWAGRIVTEYVAEAGGLGCMPRHEPTLVRYLEGRARQAA